MPKLHITLKGEDLGIFDPDEVDMEQAMQLQDQTKFTVGDLMPALGKLDARAMQALVYLQRIRQGQHPTTWHENFKFGDLDAKDVPDEDPTEAAEVAALEKALEKSGTSTSGS
jgi:hypothetical protein